MLAVNNPLDDWQPPLAKDMARIAREESETALGELAGHLRSQAAVTPGWEEYADRLGVQADEGLYVGLPPGDEDEEKVFDLEYGTEETGPSPLLRSTLSQHGLHIERQLGHAINHRVVNPRGGYF